MEVFDWMESYFIRNGQRSGTSCNCRQWKNIWCRKKSFAISNFGKHLAAYYLSGTSGGAYRCLPSFRAELVNHRLPHIAWVVPVPPKDDESATQQILGKSQSRRCGRFPIHIQERHRVFRVHELSSGTCCAPSYFSIESTSKE